MKKGDQGRQVPAGSSIGRRGNVRNGFLKRCSWIRRKGRGAKGGFFEGDEKEKRHSCVFVLAT